MVLVGKPARRSRSQMQIKAFYSNSLKGNGDDCDDNNCYSQEPRLRGTFLYKGKEESECQSHKETTHASETVSDCGSELLVMLENWVRLHKVGTKL
jgi:hypothetical protein